MSIEPTCQFCNTTSKFRCKKSEEAFECDTYKAHMKLKASVNKSVNVNQPKNKVNNTMSKTTEQLADLAGRTGRQSVAFIDAMAQRGAYKGEELQTIGQLRHDAAALVQLAEAVQTELKTEESEKKK